MKEDRKFQERLLPEGTPRGQEQAVTASGAKIAVNAGAGTGKTWVLANRYARLLMTEDPPCLPRDILTLTFTEAAASEMRERIEARTAGLLQGPDVPRPLKERSRAIRDGFGDAWISTIHSFASRLIRESGLSLDIDPRSSVISSAQEEEFWNSVRDAVAFSDLSSLARAYGDPELAEDALRLDGDPDLDLALGTWSADALRDLARSVTELQASLGHSWKDLKNEAEAALLPEDPGTLEVRERVRSLLRPYWEEVWRSWQRVIAQCRDKIPAAEANVKKKPEKAEKPEGLFVRFFRDWEERLGRDDPDEASLKELCCTVTDKSRLKGQGGRSNLFSSVTEALGMSLGKWQDAQARGVNRLLLSQPGALGPLPEPERRIRSVLLRFSAAAWGIWDAMKRRRGLLSFSDMILYAREAVLSGRVNQSFRHILVDEFQDTDPLQYGMIETLARQGRSSLFAVGDPKQSIYGFRHADPALFAKTFAEADLQVELDTSFRTRKALLGQLNRLFSFIWREGLGSSKPMSEMAFAPLSPADRDGNSERSRGTLVPFTFLLALRKGEGNSTAGVRARLAQALARHIADCVERKDTVWDKQQGKLRPVTWRDFAVLNRKRRDHDLLREAFEAEGVPAVQDSSRSYFSRGEVADVISLLRAAADPEDDAAFGGWLLSPFSGVPEAEGLECLTLCADRSGPAPRHLADIVRERLPEAAERFRRLSLVGERGGPAALISLFVQDTRWLACYSGRDRLRAVRNVRHALEIARGYQKGVGTGLVGCALWMSRALKKAVPMDEPSWLDPEQDAVLLTTIHSSKGLEYPVAALFDIPSSRRSGDRGLSASRGLGLTFSKLPDALVYSPDFPSERAGTLGLEMEKLLTAQEEKEEAERLFYVALTRARDGVLFCSFAGEKESREGRSTFSVPEDSWAASVLAWLESEGRCDPAALTGPDIVQIPPEGLPPRSVPGPEAEKERAEPPLVVARPRWDSVRLRSLSATSFSLFEWCPLVWRMRYRQGVELSWMSPEWGTAEAEGVGGTDLGSLVHWVLARWPSGDGSMEKTLENGFADPNSLVRLLPSPLRDVWREEASREALRGWLQGYEASETGARVRQALNEGTAWREERFSLSLGGLVLEGAMDVLLKEGAVWHVLDYKSTLTRGLDIPSGLYQFQLEFYALAVRTWALKNGLPFEAVKTGLVLLREKSRLAQEKVFQSGWETLEERVLSAAREAVTGSFAPKREHCPGCPWRKSCPEASLGKTKESQAD